MVESLEGRKLLASDLAYDVSSSVTQLDATLTRAADRINLVNTADSSILRSVLLADFSGDVNIAGSRRDDVVKLDPSLAGVKLNDIDISGGFGDDTVLFGGSLTTYGGSIAVEAETITVAAGAGLSTWYGPGVASTGDSGDISFTGTTIELRSGSSLQANVSNGSTFEAGDVTLAAEDSPSLAASVAGDLLTPVLVTSRDASITLNKATITGTDVDISATAETHTTWDELGTFSGLLADSTYALLKQLSSLALSAVSPITGQVKIQEANAKTIVTDSTITALDDASITATASADASFNAVGINHGLTSVSPFIATIGFGRAETTADVQINGTTVVTAGRDVNVASSTKSEAETRARSVGNGLASPSASVAFAASLAVALTEQNSTVTTGAQTKIESRQGNVAITSTGEGKTETEAEAEIYQDGVAGLTVGVSIDQTKVQTVVNGTVLANRPQVTPGYDFAAATAVDVANNTITISDIDEDSALTRGQVINYVPKAGQTVIGGLIAGASYVVSDVETTENSDGTVTQTIKLAKNATLELDGSEAQFNSEHTLSQVSLSTFDAATAASKNAANDLTLNNALLTTPLRTGDVVNYLGANAPVSLTNLAAKFTRSASGDTITRTDGGPSFSGQGLLVGEKITLANAGASNGTYTIKAISKDGLTITLAEANRLVPATTGQGNVGFDLASAVGSPVTVGGLTQGEAYLAIVDGNVVRFKDPANPGGPFIKFSAAGAGLQGFSLKRNPQTFLPSNAVDADQDTIALPNHNYQTGDAVLYHSDPNLAVTRDLYNYTANDPNTPKKVGTADIADPEIDGLTDGRIYFVVRVDANTIRLVTTPQEAEGAQAIDLTAVGSGTQSFSDPTQFKGVKITSSLEAGNGGSVGTELSSDQQSTSDAAIGATENANDLLGLMLGAPAFLGGIAGAVGAQVPQVNALSGIPLKLAATFMVSTYDHDVETIIGSTAVIKSGANLQVHSEIEQSTQTAAAAEPTRNGTDQVDPTVTGASRGQMELGVAFAHNTNRNTSRAIVESGAVLDASGDLSVESTVDYPPLSGTIEDSFNPAALIAEEGLDAFAIFIKGDLGAAKHLFNSTVVVLAGNPGAPDADLLTVAGGFDIQRFTNEATARIGDGAKINQDPAFQSDEQSVSVHATNSALLLNVAHQTALNASIGGGIEAVRNLINTGNVRSAITSIINPLGINGQNTAGPGMILNDITNTTTAEIGIGALVRTGPDGEGLSVEATNDYDNVDIVQTGANATSFGLNASIAVGTINNKTIARILPGARITGGPVAVAADDATDRFAITGGIVSTGKSGIGAAITQNTIDRTTQAYIGSPTSTAAGDRVQIEAGAADVSVEAANHGHISAYGIAGTNSSQANLVPTPGQPVIAPPAGGLVNGVSFAAGASVSINKGTDSVTAYVQNAGINAGSISVLADADTTIDSLVVGGAFGTGLTGIKVGIAGAFAFNDFSGDASAYVTRSKLNASGDDGVAVKATNAMTVNSDGGGVSVIATLGPTASRNLSAGVGVAVNQLRGSALAEIVASDVQAANDIAVEATYNPTIDAKTIAGAGAVSASPGASLNIAGAGAGAKNMITGGAQAFLLGNETAGVQAIRAGGDLSVEAFNTANVASDAGAYALSLALIPLGGLNLTVGTSVAINEIANTTLAYIKDSTAVVGGALTVLASTAATIQSRSLGGAASGGSSALAAGGAGSGNTITDVTSAYIRGDGSLSLNAGLAPIQVGGLLDVGATETSAITADGGGFALAFALSRGAAAPTVSGGVSAAINKISTRTTADLQNTTARSGGLSVTSDSATNIRALTMAGAAAASASTGASFQFAGAGAGSNNQVDSVTTATIADTTAADGSTVVTLAGPTTTGARIAATDRSTIEANGGGIALSLGLGSGAKINASFGASAAVNTINTETLAAVDNATLRTPGSGVEVQARNAQTIRALTVAGAGAATLAPGGQGLTLAGAGTGSGNSIDESTIARLSQGANVVSGGALGVAATNASDIEARAYAGALAVTVAAGASVAVGAAIAKNEITGDVLATVDNATATAAGNVTVRASNVAAIDSESVGAAVSVTALGQSFNISGSGAGAQSNNTIAKRVSATVSGRSNLQTTAGGTVAVTVDDRSTIKAVSAGGALGVSANATGFSAAIAVSAGLSTNNITNTIASGITGSGTVVNAAGGVTVQSLETANIQATAVSVSAAIAVTNPFTGAVSLAGAGARADNTVRNNVTATVNNGAAVTAVGGVLVEANDTATTNAIVPAVATAIADGIGIATGVSTSNNLIENVVAANVVGATVKSTGAGVSVRAKSADTAAAQTTPVAVSLAIGGSGQTGQTTVKINGSVNASIGAGAIVNAKGDVNVTSGSAAGATAGSNGGGAGLLNIGVISADAQVNQSTRASLDGNANVTAGNLNVTTYGLNAGDPTTSSRTAVANAIAGQAAGIGGQGVTSNAAVTGAVAAEIASGVTVNVAGKAKVDAQSTSTAATNTTSTAVGAITVSVLKSTASQSGNTSSAIGAGAKINSGSLDVTASANKKTTGDAQIVNVAIAIGAAANVAATDTANTTATVGAANGATPNINVAGAVTIGATAAEQTAVNAVGGAGGAISASVLSADAASRGSTSATLAPGSRVNAGSLAVRARDASRIVSSDLVSGELAILGVGIVQSTAAATGDVTADIGAGSVVTTPTSGSIAVEADDSLTSVTADATGGSGGLLNVRVFQSNASVGTSSDPATTAATIAAGSNLTTGSLLVDSDASAGAASTMRSGVLSFLTGVNAANSDVTINTASLATIGTDAATATNIAAASNTTISARATDAATAVQEIGAASRGLGLTLSTANAKTSNGTNARIGSGVNLTGGGLTIRANNAGESANTKLSAGAVGSLAIESVKATASSTPIVNALIDGNARVNVTGNVNVLATANGSATADATSGGVGAIQVGVARSDAFYTPILNATIGNRAVVNATGSVNVNSSLSSATDAAGLAPRITGVDTANDTVDFAYPLDAADSVKYTTTGAPIGGLTNGRVYNVIPQSTGKIRLGVIFDAGTTTRPGGGGVFTTSDLSTSRDIIYFRNTPNLQAGDAVKVGLSSGVSFIAGDNTVGKTYYVRPVYDDPRNPTVANPLAIRLAATRADALSTDEQLLKNASAVAGNRVTVPGSAFRNGQAITYRAGIARAVASEAFNATYATRTYTDANGNTQTAPDLVRDGNGNAVHANNNSIVIPNHGFQTGDPVTYDTETNSTASSQLIRGGTYYVIRVDANTVKLAESRAQALAGTAKAFSVPIGSPNALQFLSLDIGGLKNQLTYYVTNVSGTSFQLAATPGGPAITLDNAGRRGTPKFGTLGLDIQDGQGKVQLFLDLTSAGSGTQQLIGADGGPLEGLAPVATLGQSSSRARGGSIGALEVTVPSANLSVVPTVKTLIADGASITAGGNVSVTARSSTKSISSADTNGGGGISVGSAAARTRVSPAVTETRTAPNSTIAAGGDVTVDSNSLHTLSSAARSDGGGFISAKFANDTSTLAATTQTVINGKIDAQRNVALTSTASLNGRSSSEVSSIGVGSITAANNGDQYGLHLYSPSNVLIGSGSQTVGDTVTARATIGSQVVNAYAYAKSASPILLGVVTAFSKAVIDLDTPATVTISSGSVTSGTLLSGRRGVDIVATATTPLVTQYADADAIGFPPIFNSGPGGTIKTEGFVNTGRGALIVAGTRPTTGSPLRSFAGTPSLALYVNATTKTQWDADVTLTTADPVLIVGSDGAISSNVNVNATASAGNVTVNSLASPASGQVAFTGNGSVNGSFGTFTFNNTYKNINITNNGNGLLTLGDITAYGATPIQPKVTIDVPTNALEFNVNNGYTPTTINVTTAGTGNLLLTGTINNPLGVTMLKSNGSIFAQNYANGRGRIVTNQLFVETGGSFGGTAVGADRVAVGIVEAVGLPSQISIVAAANLYAGVQAQNRIRANTSSPSFTSTTSGTPSLYRAGNVADVLLEGAANYTGINNSAPDGGIQVFETRRVTTPETVGPPATTTPSTTPRTTKVFNHYRIDRGGTPVNPNIATGFFGTNLGPQNVTYNLGSVEAGTSINVQRSTIGTSTVNVISKTDLATAAAAQNVSVGTNGSIVLTEMVGDLRVGLIRSTNSNVTLTAGPNSSIADAAGAGTAGDAAADVVGTNLTLSAPGGIGSATNSLDVDSSFNITANGSGKVQANATGDIYLDETAGSLLVQEIKSNTANVGLETRSGEILAASPSTLAKVIGNTLTFKANSPVGFPATSININVDSSYSGAGGVKVQANEFVLLNETLGALNVLSVDGITAASVAPGVLLTTRDTAANGEHINVNGPVRVDDFTATSADDFVQSAAGTINSTGTVTVQVDNPSTNADAFGATLTTGGAINAQAISLLGGSQTDTFNLIPQVLPAGQTINVNGLPPSYPNDTDVLNFDSGAQTATRTVIDVTKGSGRIDVSGGRATVSYIDIGEVALTDRNDPPVNVLPPTINLNNPPFVGGATEFVLSRANGNALQVLDPDAGNATNFQVTLNMNIGRLSLDAASNPGVTASGIGTNASPLILRGSLAAINQALGRGVRVRLNTDSAQLKMVSNDNGNTGIGGPLTDTDTLNIFANRPVNQPPVNTLPAPFTSTARPVVLSASNGNAISVADVDAGNATNFYVYVYVENGTLALVAANNPGVTVQFANEGGTAVLSGTLASINAALARGIAYTPTPGFNGTSTLTVFSDDSGNTGSGGNKNDLDTTTITLARSNQPPVNRLPASPTTNNQTPIFFSASNSNALSFTDPDVNSTATNYSVRLSVTSGELAIAGAPVNVTGAGTTASPLVLTGTLAAINATLAQNGVNFTPAEGFAGAVTLTMTSNDGGNTGQPGPLTDTDTLTINVTDVLNQAPVNFLPPAISSGGPTVVLSQETDNELYVNDIDAGNATNFQVRLTPGVGTVSATPLDGVTITGAGTAASPLVLTGPLTLIDSLLANGLTFTAPVGYSGTTTLTVFSNDNGNTGSGGAKSDTDVLSVTFTAAANRPPVNGLPGVQSTAQSTPLVLSRANGTALSVADPDAGTADLTVTLAVPNGAIALLTSVTGITSNGGAGTTASPLVLTGSQAALDAELAEGVVFTPTTGFTGTTQLQMTSNDNGNTGTGGALSDTDLLQITVAGAPVAPPTVTAVLVNSTAWSSNFRDYADGEFADPSARGYRVPTGSEQSKTLPWVNVNEIKVTFNEDVGRTLTAADFSVTAAPGFLALGIPGGPVPNLIGMTYDSATFTATLSFDNVFSAAVVDLKIVSAGVANASGVPLDGEWTNDVTAGASGNGTAGGDFVFRMFMLPGDTTDESTAANDPRTVNATDALEVRDKQNGTIAPAFGALGYNARADLDGSGTINATDSLYVRNQQNATIVPSASASAAASSRRLAVDAVDGDPAASDLLAARS